jgi:excisionase family DNA binding protein
MLPDGQNLVCVVTGRVSLSQAKIENTSKWMTAEEAASYLRIEKRTILFWTRRGKLKGYRLSGTKRYVWRFLSTDLDAMLKPPSVCPEGTVQ